MLRIRGLSKGQVPVSGVRCVRCQVWLLLGVQHSVVEDADFEDTDGEEVLVARVRLI